MLSFHEVIMSMLQDKKVPIIIALVIMIVGSILYFALEIPRMEDKSMDNKETLQNSMPPEYDIPSNNANIPMIENEAVI